MAREWLIFCGLLLVVPACGRNGAGPTTRVPPVPEHLRAGRNGEPGVTRVSMDNPEAMARAADTVREREKNLLWTDPDNPESGLQDLREVMSEGSSQGPWKLSLSQAKKTGMRKGKPLVVWFTDSRGGRSPLCKSLSTEVFSTPNFTQWAADEVVRVRLDFNINARNEDDRIRKRQYLKDLKKRYKVMGTPAVFVMAPDGTVTGSYRGSERSYGQFYLDRLKRAAEAAGKHHLEWVKKMKRRGYREWTDTKGRPIFAKLGRYRKPEMILVEPDGNKIRAKESNLSSPDRLWIQQELAKRG